jgi:hypothetical protein
VTTAREFAAPEPAAESTASESPAPSLPTTKPGTASTTEHDERTVASVLATLHQQFPQTDPGTVQALVDQGFADFGGARVTTYVPVLVLHACQQQLRGA